MPPNHSPYQFSQQYCHLPSHTLWCLPWSSSAPHNNCSHWGTDHFLPRPYQFIIHYTSDATKSEPLTAVLTQILTDMQPEHVLKLLHFTRSHVERDLRLLSTSGLLYAWDIHPLHYSRQITASQCGTLTRNVMPSSHPHSEHSTVSLVQTDTTDAYRQQLTVERTDRRRTGADSKAITW